MATDLFTNLAGTTVTTGGTTAPAAGTVETWTVASSATFPAAVAGVSQFRVQEDDLTRQSEIALVTNVSGTSWTVTRGVEGTTPVAHPGNFAVVSTITAGVLGGLVADPVTTTSASGVTQTITAPTHGFKSYVVTLTANCTLTVTGGTTGEQCLTTLVLVQDATGSRTVTFPANVLFASGVAPSLSTAANARDVLSLATFDGGATFLASLVGAGFVVPVVPGAPTALAAAPTSTQNVLTWTAPVSNGGAAITAYKVYRSLTTGTETLLTTLGNVTTFTDTGLTNGTAYFYKVSAINSIGEGPLSTEASATPAAGTVPGQVAAPSATAGNTQVVLSWTQGTGTVTQNKVYRSLTTGTETLLATIAANTTYTDTGLTNGTAYFYKVLATNGNGDGTLSTEVTATPALTASYLNTASGGLATAPSSAPISGVAGAAIDLRVKCSLTTWTPAASGAFTGSWGGTAAKQAWLFTCETTGKLTLAWADTGATFHQLISTVATGFAANSVNWVRVTATVATGTATVLFYTSADGTTWTQLGTTVTVASVNFIAPSASPIGLGGNIDGPAGAQQNLLAGHYMRGEYRTTAGGAAVAVTDIPSQATIGAASWTDAQAEVWSVLATASIV